MAYTKLTPEEKQARKEARQEAKGQEKFFEDLFWSIDNRMGQLITWSEPEDARYTHDEAMMMVKLAYEAGSGNATPEQINNCDYLRTIYGEQL